MRWDQTKVSKALALPGKVTSVQNLETTAHSNRKGRPFERLFALEILSYLPASRTASFASPHNLLCRTFALCHPERFGGFTRRTAPRQPNIVQGSFVKLSELVT